MRFLTRMNWNFSRAIRTILVIALAVLAISAMKVAPDVEEWHLVVVAAIGSMALINLELKPESTDGQGWTA